ncbi:MAG: ion transporter [Phenylobacterium sp.]|uniref:ion transporter n=1 Tax=Phenylobacterium sp. TaxID=1871053 RepID=UPI00391B740B
MLRLKLLRDLEAWIEKPMLALSALWLALLVVELAWGLPRILQTLSLVIWGVFILEFGLRLALAPHKLSFIAQNLLTMAALVLPAMRLFRIARVLRFARGATLLRVVAGANRSMNALRRSMEQRGFGYVAALTMVVCVLGALGMRTFEAGGPNGEAFSTFGDALWWTAMILTTMGSQSWPATPEGRLLALILSIYAFAVFGYVAAALASFFVGRDQESRHATRDDVEALRQEVEALRKDLRRT